MNKVAEMKLQVATTNLIDEMRVLGPARSAEILDLHDLGEDGLVEAILQCWS